MNISTATLLLTVILLSVANPSLAAEDERPALAKLSWLLGEWVFRDAAVDDSYWERGTRSCELTLHNQYIHCQSRGLSNTGSDRSYSFILGYNSMDERYEMIGLTSNYPRQNLYVIEVSEDGHTLELSSQFWTADGLSEATQATIRFDGHDQYFWETRTGEVDPATGQRAVTYIDTVTKASH